MIRATVSVDWGLSFAVTNAHPLAIIRASATPAGVRSGQKLQNALSKYAVANSVFVVRDLIW